MNVQQVSNEDTIAVVGCTSVVTIVRHVVTVDSEHTDAVAVVGRVLAIALLLPFAFVLHAIAVIGYYIAIVRYGSSVLVVEQDTSAAIAGQVVCG